MHSNMVGFVWSSTSVADIHAYIYIRPHKVYRTAQNFGWEKTLADLIM